MKMLIHKRLNYRLICFFLAGVIIGSLFMYVVVLPQYSLSADRLTAPSCQCSSMEEEITDYKRKFARQALDALLNGRRRKQEKSFQEMMQEQGQIPSVKGKEAQQPMEATARLTPTTIAITARPEQYHGKVKYLMSYYFREQLTGAIKHFIYLAGVAQAMGRAAVVPFTAQSYIIGAPGSKTPPREDIGEYFDLDAMNRTLLQNNYAPLANYSAFNQVCQNHLDVLIFFMYRLSPAYNWMVDQMKEIKHPSLEEVLQATKSTGYTDCTWMQPLWMLSQKTYGDTLTARRILCVDEQVITSAHDLEKILGDQPCVGVYRWTGVTYPTMKLPFTLDNIPKEVTHQDFPVAAPLRRRAQEFIRMKLPGKYLAVHARLEYCPMIQKFLRNLTWSNVRQSSEYKSAILLLKNSSAMYREVKRKHGITTTFLATDMSMYGSTAMLATITNPEHLSIMQELRKMVNDIYENPVIYDAFEAGTDRGKVAITESEILSHGAALLIIGGGKFQNEFVVEKFLRNHDRNLDLLYHGWLDSFWYNLIIGTLKKEKQTKS